MQALHVRILLIKIEKWKYRSWVLTLFIQVPHLSSVFAN